MTGAYRDYIQRDGALYNYELISPGSPGAFYLPSPMDLCCRPAAVVSAATIAHLKIYVYC